MCEREQEGTTEREGWGLFGRSEEESLSAEREDLLRGKNKVSVSN